MRGEGGGFYLHFRSREQRNYVLVSKRIQSQCESLIPKFPKTSSDGHSHLGMGLEALFTGGQLGPGKAGADIIGSLLH